MKTYTSAKCPAQRVCKVNICVPYQMPSTGIFWKADFLSTH